LYLFHWVGIALILGGIALATRGERRGVPEPIPE
jgi:drug/metabolite transporter (DMT)-like permease